MTTDGVGTLSVGIPADGNRWDDSYTFRAEGQEREYTLVLGIGGAYMHGDEMGEGGQSYFSRGFGAGPNADFIVLTSVAAEEVLAMPAGLASTRGLAAATTATEPSP